MLRPDYPIETDRLLLRPLASDDVDALYAFQSLPEVTRYLYWEPRTQDQVRDTLAVRISQTELADEGDVLSLGVELRTGGLLIGTAMLNWLSQEHQQGELGYVLHPEHAGNGYATEIARALLRLGFGEAKLHRLTGRCDGRNAASMRVLAKAGMRKEAHLRQNEWVKGEWVDEVIYALLREEWEQEQSR